MVYGNNKRPALATKSFCELLYGALNDFTLKILLVCATVSIIISTATAKEDHRSTAWIEGFAIYFAVALSSGV
jgi:hypothetical protein